MEKSKLKIIEAADNLISDKGITYATIARIAKEAKVATSLIYNYFDGKEDLLFSIAIKRMNEALAELKEHLLGIRDPESRLRKLIWYSLRYNDLHPTYIKILLFEARSNKKFYSTFGYQVMKDHLSITMDILNQGVAEGSFRNDIDMRLVRDIIYGTLDFEGISKTTGEIEESVNDFDDIMTLILSMINIRDKSRELSNEKKILIAAEKVFIKNGFKNAKISEIAKLAGVAEGTIYDYFEDKEDLIISIPTRWMQKHFVKFPETFNIRSPLMKLKRLIGDHFIIFLSHKEFLRVFLLDIQFNSRFYRSKAYDSFRQYLGVIEKVIEEGKANQSFRPDANARVFRNMLLGAFSHMALRWVVVKSDKKFDEIMEVDRLIRLLSSAVIAPDPK